MYPSALPFTSLFAPKVKTEDIGSVSLKNEDDVCSASVVFNLNLLMTQNQHLLFLL